MKLYASCPFCGYKMFKAEPKSDVEIICPKCKASLRVIVEADGIKVIPIEKKNKQN